MSRCWRTNCGAIATVLLFVAGCGADTRTPLAPSEGTPEARRASSYAARIELGTLGGNVSYANAINALGAVVGSSETAGGQTHAFRWTLAGGMVDLGVLPGDDGSIASDIDDQGAVLGVSFAGTVNHQVTWNAAGAIHPLVLPFTVPAGVDAVALAGLPNGRGELAGTAHVEGACCASDATFFYSAETGLINLRRLGEESGIDATVFGTDAYNDAVDLNEGGTVLGLGGFEDAWRPFLWSPTGGFQLPGVPPGSSSHFPAVVGLGLNNLNEVVGWFQGRSEGGLGGPFRWSPKKGFTLLAGGGYSGYATAINDEGEAAGTSFATDTAAAAAWPRSGNLKLLATNTGKSSIALDINGDGLAVGWEGSGSGLDNHAVLWNTALAHIVPGGKAKGPRVASSGFEAKVTQCLGHPSSRTARALCFAR